MRSYDLVDKRMLLGNVPNNIEFRIGDFTQDSEICKSPLILIDTDPHDGIQEEEFHRFLLSSAYKGLVIWDDIHLNPAMRAFWDSIKGSVKTKVDLTAFGHWSGTGLVIYGQ